MEPPCTRENAYASNKLILVSHSVLPEALTTPSGSVTVEVLASFSLVASDHSLFLILLAWVATIAKHCHQSKNFDADQSRSEAVYAGHGCLPQLLYIRVGR
jgi:hypothetical protein